MFTTFLETSISTLIELPQEGIITLTKPSKPWAHTGLPFGCPAVASPGAQERSCDLLEVELRALRAGCSLRGRVTALSLRRSLAALGTRFYLSVLYPHTDTECTNVGTNQQVSICICMYVCLSLSLYIYIHL